jgi:hypothetical protein
VPENNQVFVVMQVGEEGSAERKRADEVYNFIVAPALETVGLVPYRADLDPSPGSITPKMLNELLSSRGVIADLTGRNPNVYYELGITHSFARPLVCLVDSPDSLPFDAKDERAITVGKFAESGLAYAQGKRAEAALVQSLQVIMAEGYVPPSPVRDAATTQSLDALAADNPVISEMERMGSMLETLIERVPAEREKVWQTAPAVEMDVESMRTLLASLVTLGRLSARELTATVTNANSRGPRRWVQTVYERENQTLEPDWDLGMNDEPARERVRFERDTRKYLQRSGTESTLQPAPLDSPVDYVVRSIGEIDDDVKRGIVNVANKIGLTVEFRGLFPKDDHLDGTP